MRLAFLVDPLESLRSYKDSSVAMMQASAARGHALFALQQGDLLCRNGAVSARVCSLELSAAQGGPWYQTGASQECSLAQFDAVLMRKDPPFDLEYIYATYLLEMAQEQGALVINRPRALRDYNEKLSIHRFIEFTVPTLVTRQEGELRAFLQVHGDVVFKPLDGMGGASVFRVRQNDPNVGVIIETLTRLGQQTIMAQRYIPEISQGDKRVLLIGGDPVPYALARIPKAGETRGNLAAGGRGVAQPLSPRDREIALSLGPRLAADGLDLVGLDVIGDYLTEVNVTSPTGMREIMTQTGCDVAGLMIEQVERRVNAR